MTLEWSWQTPRRCVAQADAAASDMPCPWPWSSVQLQLCTSMGVETGTPVTWAPQYPSMAGPQDRCELCARSSPQPVPDGLCQLTLLAPGPVSQGAGRWHCGCTS